MNVQCFFFTQEEQFLANYEAELIIFWWISWYGRASPIARSGWMEQLITLKVKGA